MKTHYDLIFSTPTYHSVKERLAKFYLPTLKYLDCDVLSVIITQCKEDTEAVIPLVNETKGTDIVLFEFNSNFMIQAIDWTPLWAIKHGLSAKYYTFMPDNNEFLEGISSTTIDLLDLAFDKTNFCIATFCDGIHSYVGWGKDGAIDGHIEVNPTWIDNPHFIPWKDVFSFGLWDGPTDYPCPLFVDMEYVHRAKILSGRPVVVDTTFAFTGQYQYIHHHANDNVTALRSANAVDRINYGVMFWITKYGLNQELVWINPHMHFAEIYEAIQHPPYSERMKRHIIFNNIWDDYDAIYNLLRPHFKLITSNCGVERE